MTSSPIKKTAVKYGSRYLLVIFLALGIDARTFYVATNGSNSNPGTITEPWLTISYAASPASGVVAGDTIKVRAGNYPEAITVGISGIANAPIVLMNYGAENVTLDPGRIRFDDGIDYWKVDGFGFLNSSASGLRISGTHAFAFLTVKNCIFSHHRENGVSMTGPDYNGVTIEDCVIEWNGEENGVPSGIEGSGIVMYGDRGVLWARRNLIANNWAKGISHGSEFPEYYGDSSIIDSNIIFSNFESGIDWQADNSFIRYNWISLNGVRDPEAGEWGDKGLALTNICSNTLVAFNVIKSSGNHEISPRGYNNKFYNNTFIKDYYYTTVPGSPYATVIIFFDTDGPDNEFRNNIIINLCDESQHHFAIIAEMCERYLDQTWSNNLYWCPNATDPPPANKPFKLYGFPGSTYATLSEIQAQYPSQEIGSLYTDPDFVSYADSNFNLLPGSPAIDAGVDVGFPYSGAAPDIGAFEYVADTTSDSTQLDTIFGVYPNPFVNQTNIVYDVAGDIISSVRIYDVSGRIVRNLPLSTAYCLLPTSFLWDGTDDSGNEVPVGVYFLRLVAQEPGEEAIKIFNKITRLR